MISSRLSLLVILLISTFLKTAIRSLTKAVSCSLFGAIDNLEVLMNSSTIGMLMVRRAWSKERQWSGHIECWLSLLDPYHRNIKSITEFASPAISENLVGEGLVGVDNIKLKESAIIIRSLLIEEWWGKDKSHKLSLMLKSPVIIRMLSMLTSISLRYFKAVWDKSEYMFNI